MGVESYFLKFVKATYISRRRSEMIKTIENLKRNIFVYNNYCCKNIIYHTNENRECFKNEFHVYLDSNLLNVLEFANILNLNKTNTNTNTNTNTSKEKEKEKEKEHSSNQSSLKKNESSIGSIHNEKNETKEDDVYILNYKINHIISRRGKREQYRYTYLKSPFKYKYALRHYVFEKYKYIFYFYNITHYNINIIFNIILSSLSSNTSVKCNINWFYPGERLMDSVFFKNIFDLLIKNRKRKKEDYETTIDITQQNESEKKNEFLNTDSIINTDSTINTDSIINTDSEHHINNSNVQMFNYNDLNLDLRKYNIQDLLPLFFENKTFTVNYKKQILLEEKSFKQIKNKIKKKNVHWFLNKTPSV